MDSNSSGQSREERADPCGGASHHKPTRAVQHMIALRSKAQMRRRPKLRRWRSKAALVQRQRFGILPAVVHLGLGAARRRVMVQRRLQAIATPDRPIITRIGQVLMPDLVDNIARCYRRRRNDAEEAEATISLDGCAGMREAPA